MNTLFNIDISKISKIKRNDPCWCGSGKKHKKCHLDREKQPEKSKFHAASILENSKRKLCAMSDSYQDECAGKIIKAHTVSKSSSLKTIAREGHVYSMSKSANEMHSNEGRYKPKLIGINVASTFTGFCQKHDRDLFSPIENKIFSWEMEQVLLVAYRGLTYEWYAKSMILEQEEYFKSLDAGKPLYAQIEIQQMMSNLFITTKIALEEISGIKSKFERFLKEKDFSKINYVGFEFSKPLPVMGSGGFAPVYDLIGNKIQNLLNLNVTAEAIFYSSFASENKGIFCVIWINEGGNAAKQFSESLTNLEDGKIANAIINTLFSNSENIYLAPDWWETLSKDEQKYLIYIFSDSVNPDLSIKNYKITDVVDATVLLRKNNV